MGSFAEDEAIATVGVWRGNAAVVMEFFCFGWCDLTFGEVDVNGGGGRGRCTESFRE